MSNPIWVQSTSNFVPPTTINRVIGNFRSSITFYIDFSGIMEGRIGIKSESSNTFGNFLVSIFDLFNSPYTDEGSIPFFQVYGYQDIPYGTFTLSLPSGKYLGKITNLDSNNDITINVTKSTLSWQ